MYGTSAARARHTGKAAFDARGVLVISWQDKARESFIVRGWFFGKDVVILRIHGPHEDKDPITDEMLSNPNYNLYMIHSYTKKR